MSISNFFKALIGVFCLLLIPAYSVNATEALPGEACTTAGRYTHSGGPEVSGGGYKMVCDGTVWKVISEYSSSSGRVKINIDNDTGACNSTKTGRLRYDGAATWEYCNGSAWVPFERAGASCLGPASCPNIGNVCTDGSVFAGCAPENSYRLMFITRCDAGQTWSGSACTGTRMQSYWSDSASTTGGLRSIGVTTAKDGVANTTALTVNTANSSGDSRGAAGVQIHQAAKYCADLTMHGKTDWYLPAQTEMYSLFMRESLLPNFTPEAYWTSTEYNASATLAWVQLIGYDGDQYNIAKNDNTSLLRCMRAE